MAITRVRQTGAELGSKYAEVDGTSAYITDGCSINSSTKYTGSYSYYQNNTSITNSYWYMNFSALAQGRIGMWYYKGTSRSDLRYSVKIRDTAGEFIGFRVSNDSSDLVVNGASQDTGSSWAGGWAHLGIDWKVHSTSGWVYVYRNGLLDMSYDGDTGTNNANQFRMGKHEGANYSFSGYFDDFYLDNTSGEASPAAPPILRFYYVAPNGNGNYSQWTGSDGDSTDNYLLVDEIPPVTTDYTEADATDEYDSYAMNSITLADGQLVKAVIPTIWGKRNGSTEQIALGTRYSSTDLVGSDQTPSGSYDVYSERQTTKPGGGDWDQTSIDGMEVLLKSRGTY